MGLGFSSCSDKKEKCRIVVDGNKVILYDPDGNVSVEHTCYFHPTSVYWSEGPFGGACIVCENGSFEEGEYFSNCGTGVLPFIPYSCQK